MSPVHELARANAVARSDSELLDEVIAGSAGALGELYDRYSARAFRVARSVTGDHAAAEDAVQEAFASIFRRRMTRRSRGTCAAWVLTVVLHRAIDLARVEARHAPRRASEDGRVRAALAALPDSQREAVILAYYGELTHVEIAEGLGVPFGTVKGRIRLGMDKLRLAFEPTEWGGR
jgi:RNA polymerase sigma-70 factor, ECF subfamily